MSIITKQVVIALQSYKYAIIFTMTFISLHIVFVDFMNSYARYKGFTGYHLTRIEMIENYY